MQTSANIRTETQINGCLHYAIPCAYFFVCCCCDGCRACMKLFALNMNDGRRQLNCFCDEYWPHFPWTNNSHGVQGSFLFIIVTLLLCCCARCNYSLVCVHTLREGCRHDGPLSPCVLAVEPCVPLLFASPSSICLLVLRQGCVCVCVAVDWSVCCAWCAAYGACLAASLSSCGVPSVCVSAAPLVSPVALHVPHCADQLHTTEIPHSR
ncbi:mucin TcMUC [Trypanosoma cruzi Dm28c]|uniref:Mucin TcMUC n=1 Tax=Trypanosoma cruzi Dm28c TaxID=1416333 RepID=V5AJM3_TRYCR|nr:mucin TcMUC [Trypanosoma cruzi Dm28c]